MWPCHPLVRAITRFAPSTSATSDTSTARRSSTITARIPTSGTTWRAASNWRKSSRRTASSYRRRKPTCFPVIRPGTRHTMRPADLLASRMKTVTTILVLIGLGTSLMGAEQRPLNVLHIISDDLRPALRLLRRSHCEDTIHRPARLEGRSVRSRVCPISDLRPIARLISLRLAPHRPAATLAGNFRRA